ncbi:MAG: single-stranded-DNA-specific exonuclease RecJ [Clostridia bacterium]|nr:single-stranded-DNA-specific exonuclease RecJ [Clostridia bacterium]
MSRRKWQINKVDKALAADLAERHTLFALAALIASSRGIDTDEKIRAFFYDEAQFALPWDFPDMQKAVDAINYAIDRFERIAICGDYDADGITASALLYSYLEQQGADVICRIPDRSEGYGLKKEAIDYFVEQNVKLIITVDCGISSVEEAEYAAEKGIKMVITDHHICGDVLPVCEAVVDPYRSDCMCNFKAYAGVGVVYKLLCALEDGDSEYVLDTFADIIAIGTVGDVMPLIDENRLIVRRGVEMINSSDRPGIMALRESTGQASKYLSASSLAFTLVPRINAAGRMGSPTRALNLLLGDDISYCRDLAAEIDSANIQRHNIELQIIAGIKQKFIDDPTLRYDRVIVVDGEGWPHGIVGIVAAKLVEIFGKPAIVISDDGDICRGSGRSFDGFSLYDAIKSCEDVLDHFGGHTLAAGIGIKPEMIPEFRRRINEYAALLGEVKHPVLKIDCKLNPVAINNELLDTLATLEPFGAGNPVPVFGLFGMRIDAVQSVSEGRHIRLILSKGDTRISAMRFGVSPDAFPFYKGDVIDVAATVEKNEYLGEVRPSVQIKAVRGHGIDDDLVLGCLDLFEKIMRGEVLTAEEKALAYPDRDFMLSVFRFVKSCGCWTHDYETLCFRLTGNSADVCKIAVSVEAMLELGVLIKNEHGQINLPEVSVKADLGSSKLLSKLK